MAVSQLSYGPNRAVRKLSLPEGLWNRFSLVSQVFWRDFGVVWPPPGLWIPLALPGSLPNLETNKKLPHSTYCFLNSDLPFKEIMVARS